MFTIWEVLLSNVLVAAVVSAGWVGYVRPLRKRLTRHSGVREDGED